MAIKKKVEETFSVEIGQIEVAEMTFNILGVTPLICNRQSEKAKRQLTLPPLPQNRAQRTQTLKHEPFEEFRASPYLSRREKNPKTWLHLPSGMFKKSPAQAALDIPGATKAQIGRLVSVSSESIPLWGIPYMRADMVRQAGPSRTPDVRFRACLPEWASQVTYKYLPRIISPNSLSNLVFAAGIIVGIGDYRVEKGAGDYGQFKIVNPNNRNDVAEWEELVATADLEPQKAAMETPQYYDDDTRELVEWFIQEVDRRRQLPAMAMTTEEEEIEVDGIVPDDDGITEEGTIQ